MRINEATSNGVYSLKTGWLKTPVKDDIPDDVDLEPELSEFRQRAAECQTIEEVDNFIDDIYKLRQESILTDGEYGKGNLVFKELRNDGTLQQLKDKKVELENDEMSLTEDFDLLVDDLIDDYYDMIVSKADIEAARQEIASHYNEEIADRVADELIKMIDTVDESLTEGIEVGQRYVDTAKGRRCKVVNIKDVNREKHNSLGSFKDADVVIEYDNDKSRTYTFKKGEFNVRFIKESLNESELNEASADKQRFIDKFGQENFDTFWNNKQRLKSFNINPDILYHVKNTSLEDMNMMMDKVRNTASKNKKMKAEKEGADLLYADDHWRVYKINTYDAAKYYGKGTVWCIAGNYHGIESQGQYYFDKYLYKGGEPGRYDNVYDNYILYIDLDNNRKYMACTFHANPKVAEIWDENDETPTFEPNSYDQTIPGHPPVIPGLPNVAASIGDTFGYRDKVDNLKFNRLKTMEVIPPKFFLDAHPKANFTLDIPNNIKEIGKRAFFMCTRLTDVTIPNSVEKIGNDAFEGCVRLRTMKIPSKFRDDIERIGVNTNRTSVEFTENANDSGSKD